MPRCVRNFWVDASIDGRASTFASGPRSKDGGIRLHYYQRKEGDIVCPFSIRSRATSDNTLITTINLNTRDQEMDSFVITIDKDQEQIQIVTKR